MEDIVIESTISLRETILEVYNSYMCGGYEYIPLMLRANKLFGKEACSKMWDEIRNN